MADCKYTPESLTRNSTLGSLQDWWNLANTALENAETQEAAEKIKAAMNVRRHPSSVVGILTHEKADELLRLVGGGVQNLLIEGGVTTVMSDTHYFITDGCLYYDLPGFVPIQHKNFLSRRSGDFKNVAEACAHYATNLEGQPLKFIASLEELAAHLNGEDLEPTPQDSVEMYYCTRYLHNPDKQTEYYVGGGVWAKKDLDRIRVRMYEKEGLARAVCDGYPESDWHSVQIHA